MLQKYVPTARQGAARHPSSTAPPQFMNLSFSASFLVLGLIQALLHFENMISRLLGLIWLFSRVFAQDDDASPTVIEINYGSTTKLMTITTPTGTATSTPTRSSASTNINTNTAPSASSTHITRIVILIVTAVVCIPCGLILRRYRRQGYFFRPPKKPERKPNDTHLGIAELPQGRYHETTELMAEDSPGEMGLGGHHEMLEMEGSLLQPKEMPATGSTCMKWGTTSPEIQGFERKRGSMEISPC